MKILKGTGASGGLALGYAVHLNSSGSEEAPQRETVEDAPQEVERFQRARCRAIQEVESLCRKADKDVGEESLIFAAHKAMLEDQDLIEDVTRRIREKKMNAEFAVYESVQAFEDMFSEIIDDYMRERVADLRDVGQRLRRSLTHQSEDPIPRQENMIILARDLLPSQTMQLDKTRVRAFITQLGSPNSHAAILARSREIPAVVSVEKDLWEIPDGALLLVDGDAGLIYQDPSPKLLDWYRTIREKHQHDEPKVHLPEGESRTLDGHLVHIRANVSSYAEAQEAARNHSDGIGLLRSEFLYMSGDTWPDEERQFSFYKSILETMPDKPVVIRTCDLGMDKTAGYWKNEDEVNPALGIRGIRLSLQYPAMFITQLRALLRASVYGQLWVMFPMIATVQELDRAMGMVREARRQLEADGEKISPDIRYGMMIETPAAALLSDVLAKKADFFSIGTNDLVQYTLCADRTSATVGELYDPCDPAVLRLIRYTIKNIHREGKPCSVCGDAATNGEFAGLVISMGIDGLSVPPAKVPQLRYLVQNSYRGKGE